jgi:MFS family permease
MAVVWSVATIACGFARNFGQLLAARSVVGLGEAGYGAAGGALLSSMFPASRRATVLGAFLAAAALGSVLGVVLGGFISARWGWQAAFGVMGVPGLILALLFLSVRDYRTVPLVDAKAARMDMKAVVRALFKPRSAVAANVGGALQLLAVSTVYAWLPSYLNRFHGLAVDKAGAMSAIILLIGCIGIVVWSHVADRLSRANPCARMMVPACCMVVTTLLLSPAFGLVEPGNAQFLLITAGSFMMTSASGSIP